MLKAAVASLTSVTWYPSRRHERNENILIRRIAETHFNRDAEQELGLTRRRDRRMLKFGIVAVRRVAGSPINRDFEAVVFRPPGQFDSWDGRVRSHKRVATHLTGRGEATIPIATTPPWGDE